MSHLKSKYLFRPLILLGLVIGCCSCNTTVKVSMDQFVAGKIISMNDSVSKIKEGFGFAMQTDSTMDTVFAFAGKKFKDLALLKQLKTGQHVKVKGERVVYVKNGKQRKDAAGVILFDQLKILE